MMPAQTLLLIDDSSAIRTSMNRLLRRSFRILMGASAEEGLRLMEAHPDIDVILCDVMMPGIGAQGLLPQLTDRLRQRTVLMTAGAPSQALLLLLDRFGIPLVRKPFTLPALLATLSERITSAEEPAYRALPATPDDSAAMPNSHPA